MRIFTCTEFRGHWPVGTAAVIVAADAERASEMLMARLAEIGLDQMIDPIMLEPLAVDSEAVLVLHDGDY